MPTPTKVTQESSRVIPHAWRPKETLWCAPEEDDKPFNWDELTARQKARFREKKSEAKHRNARLARARNKMLDPKFAESEKKRKSEYRKRNRAALREKYKVYYKRNKHLILPTAAISRSLRKQLDPEYKIKCSLRSRLSEAMKRHNFRKSEKTLNLIGCSIGQLKSWLESKWRPGMCWDNHKHDGWHIDHIKPCGAFDLTDPEQQKACFHYTNLQPLWWYENLQKNDSYETPK